MFHVGDLPVLTFRNCVVKTGFVRPKWKWPLKLCVRFYVFFQNLKNMTIYVFWVVAHVFSNTGPRVSAFTGHLGCACRWQLCGTCLRDGRRILQFIAETRLPVCLRCARIREHLLLSVQFLQRRRILGCEWTSQLADLLCYLTFCLGWYSSSFFLDCVSVSCTNSISVRAYVSYVFYFFEKYVRARCRVKSGKMLHKCSTDCTCKGLQHGV